VDALRPTTTRNRARSLSSASARAWSWAIIPDPTIAQRFGHDISSQRRFRSLTDDEAAATLKTPCAP
jgi:hypothetical protein